MKTLNLSIMILSCFVLLSVMLSQNVAATVPLVEIMLSGTANNQNCENKCVISQTVNVQKGTAVEWINNDLVPHTLVSGKPEDKDNGTLFDTGQIWVGKFFIHNFNDVGVYHYFERDHPQNTGIINVTDWTYPKLLSKVMTGFNAKSGIASPLKQFKGGIISILDVKCMPGFDRLVKTSDGSPACVKPLSGKILIERGWATRTIKVQNTDFEINYAIAGGKLTGATEDLYPQELILSLQTSSDGYLTVNIPKGLINLRNIDYWTDGTIHVSTNYKEINFKQYKSLGYVVITVALKNGMTQVEISSGIPGAVEEGK